MPAGLARLEVTFDVDADGLLDVSARETRTGIEQKVEVKPSYGLDDDQVEQMLMDALDYGEQDLAARRLAEQRVEAQRILMATRHGLAVDADLLQGEEKARVEAVVEALSGVIEGSSAAAIESRISELDRLTHDWAGRRMDRAIANAIAGKSLGDVESSVKDAAGTDAHTRASGEA